jgi:polysaccharide export outer membrane protein
LTGLLFAGCQTNKANSGFSEVPGLPETTAPAPTAAANPATSPGAANSGASTNGDGSWEIITTGDVLVISFADLPPGTSVPPFDQRVRDDGTITLIYNQLFHAAGKRVGDLEKEIHDFYVPSYFRNLTVTVRISRENRFYYVDGEVRAGGKFPYVSSITVSKAIAAAGGFTDFASKRKVKLIRAGGSRQTVNCNKVLEHPELDPLVFPDDKIHVPRRLLW